MKMSDISTVNALTQRLKSLPGACRALRSGDTQAHRIEITRAGGDMVARVDVGSFGSEQAKALTAEAVTLVARAIEIEHGHLTEQLQALGVDPDTEEVRLSPTPSNTEGQ